MRASVIIVGYNSFEDLPRCLTSLQPTLGSDDEVILVDNGSTDGSADQVERAFPWVRLVRSPHNLGFAGGCNLGAQAARGKYLAFLNPDTTVKSRWIQSLTEVLEDNPKVGLATSKILQMNEPVKVSACGNNIHISGITMGRGMRQRQEIFTHPEEVTAISGAAFCISKDLFSKIDGFDEDFFLYMEDTDISLRARLSGYTCMFVPDSIIYHDYQLNINSMKTYYQERNRYLMLMKNYRWPTLLVLLPSLLAAELITWCYIFLRDRRNIKNKVLAYRWILDNWKTIKEKRIPIQSRRSVKDRELLQSMAYCLDFEQTGGSLVPRIAHLVFDPLFIILKGISLLLIRW